MFFDQAYLVVLFYRLLESFTWLFFVNDFNSLISSVQMALFGVSRMNGISSMRGSLINHLKKFIPINPFPIL